MPGALLCCSVHQAHRGDPLTRSCSVDWPIRHLKRHPGWVLLYSVMSQALDGPVFLLFSCQCCQCWSVGRERKAMVMVPPAMCNLTVLPCVHGCLAFLHRHFPAQSPSSHPPPTRYPHLSLQGQQRPSPWYCSTISKLQLPAVTPSRVPASLSVVCTAAARTV